MLRFILIIGAILLLSCLTIAAWEMFVPDFIKKPIQNFLIKLRKFLIKKKR